MRNILSRYDLTWSHYSFWDHVWIILCLLVIVVSMIDIGLIIKYEVQRVKDRKQRY